MGRRLPANEIVLSEFERIRFEEEFGGAAEAVVRVLPGVVLQINWDLLFETDCLNVEFLAEAGRLICGVDFYEGARHGDEVNDRWMRGTIRLRPDGAPGDPDPETECQPDLWRVAVLEEFAAAIRRRRPKGAAYLRSVAEFLRPKELACDIPGKRAS